MFLESWHQVDIFTLVSWLSHSIADSKTGLPEIFREAPRNFAVVLFDGLQLKSFFTFCHFCTERVNANYYTNTA